MPRGKTKSTASSRPATAIHSIADFARHLNLSAWTISRAINGHPEVNEQTRQRVLAAMDELGFRPNPLARGLGGRRTGMIGVCFMGLGNPIVDRKVYALQEFFRSQHLQTLLEVRMRDRQQELRAIENFHRIRVDGVVLMYSELDGAEAVAALRGMPCVQVDPHRPQKLPSVSLDRQKAMRLLMDLLFRLDHTRFGFLGTGKTDVWRWPAVVEIAKARGLDPDEVFIEIPDRREFPSPVERGQLMAQSVLEMKRRPTALLAENDQIALGAVHTLRDAGVHVPREISVTGFDNLDVGRKLHPTLTTIDQNPLRLMERAGEILLEQIRLPAAKRGGAVLETVAPELIIGESTGPAPLR